MEQRRTSIVAQAVAWLGPVAWLGLAVAGLIVVCVGVIIDVYRHDHGADAAVLISTDNPGSLVALAGFAMLAIGLLGALSVLAFQSAHDADAAVRRGALVVLAWAAVATASVAAVTYVATTGVTIAHEGHDDHAAPPAPTAVSGVPGSERRVALSGAVTLDGAPFDAEFFGVRVVHDGLPAVCQLGVVPVEAGRYKAVVLAEQEVRGCGQEGAELLVWTFVDETFVYSAETMEWPGDGKSVTFDATFSTADPEGASFPTTEVHGLLTKNGAPLPGGTIIEAYAGDVRCGISSLRYSGDFEGYAVIVAGPASIPDCREGSVLSFRVDGEPVEGTITHNLARGQNGHELDFVVE